jgi:hypothetical protein
LTSLYVGVNSKPLKNNRMGMVSPRYRNSNANKNDKYKQPFRDCKKNNNVDSTKVTSNRSPVHDFKLCNCFAFIVLVGCSPCTFAPYDGEFHVFDFDADEEKVDFADNHVAKMIPVNNIKT